MAAPLELSCWGGGWGLPSVHSDSLVVMVRPSRWRGRGQEGAGPEARGWLAGSRRLKVVPARRTGPGRPGRCLQQQSGLPRVREVTA